MVMIDSRATIRPSYLTDVSKLTEAKPVKLAFDCCPIVHSESHDNTGLKPFWLESSRIDDASPGHPPPVMSWAFRWVSFCWK